MGGFSPSSPFAQAVKNLGMDRPEVPTETYDDFRNQYFNKRIAPKLHPSQKERQRETFLQRTQRPSMSGFKQAADIANIAVAQFERTAGSVAKPFSQTARNEDKALGEQITKKRQELAWHGKAGGGAAELGGGIGGYALTMPAAEGALGAVAEAIPQVGAAAKVLKFGAPGIVGAARRSLAFAALQSLEADPGKHISEFAKGTAWGIGGELVGAALGQLWKYYKGRKQLPTPKEVDDFVKEMARGEVSDHQVAKDLDAALAQDVTESAQQAGPLGKLQTVVNEKVSRPIAHFIDEKGHKVEMPLSGDAEKVYAQLNDAVKAGRSISHIEHDEADAGLINDVLSKLKQTHEPWSTVPTQIANDSTNKGIDAGGGTARVDNKVLKFRYAKEAPSQAEAKKFIQGAGLDKNQTTDAIRHFDTVWDPFAPYANRMRSAERLEEQGLVDILPSPETRAKWGKLPTPKPPVEEEVGALEKRAPVRLETEQAPPESYYARIGRLAETLAKEKDPDLTQYYEQYGYQAVDTAMNMAGVMWEKAEGDLSKVKWSDEVLKAGIEEGHLPSTDTIIQTSSSEELRQASVNSRVLKLAEAYNVDPKSIDKELLEQTSDEEIERAHSVADAAKKSGVSVYDASLNEEARRLGILGEDIAYAPKGVPPSELPSREPGEPAGLPTRKVRLPNWKMGQFSYSVRRAISGLPSRIYIMFDDEVKSQLSLGGAHGSGASMLRHMAETQRLDVVVKDLKAIADLNGIDLDKALISIIHRPNAGFQKGASTSTLWHEDLHGMLSQLGMLKAVENKTALRGSTGSITKLLSEVYQSLPAESQQTWQAFAKALKNRYGALYNKVIISEEAFVHAATAIRHGDVGIIAHFGAVDTDVEHVYEAVQSIAGKLRLAAGEMTPGASKNMITDRLGFLEGISSVDRYKAIREAAEQLYASVGGDSNAIMQTAGLQYYTRLGIFFDTVEDSLDGRVFAPNYTSWAEAAGARHALYPSQIPPGRTPPPMPEQRIEDGWHFVGASALWEKIAPTFSFINHIDSKLNAKYGVKGSYLPLADKAKAVDEAYRAGEAWLNANRESALGFLEGGKKKLETYGYVLTKPLREWGGIAQKLQLTNEDLARLKQAREWLTKFEDDSSVRVMNYLQELQPKLANHGYDVERVFPTPAKGSSMSTFHRLISTGELNPRDLHLGRLVNVFLREGMEKKFTGDALRDFQKVIDHKVDGKYALGVFRAPLQRYAEYMKGIPDNGGKMINRFVADFQGGINNVIKNVNKHLPEGFKAPEVAWTGDALRKAILLSYIGGIGGRPAIAIRDGIQGFSLSFPIIGAKAYLKGIGLAITKEHWNLAEEAGVVLKGKNVGELFGDIYQEMTPGKGGLLNKAIDTASALLAPSRWGHNFARRTVFAGVYDDTLPAVKGLRSLPNLDRASAQKFLDRTGLWFADEARQKQLLSLASDKFVPPKEVAKQIALEMLDLTLWPYRRGTQPGFLKTGVGRVFGQYGLWPMSFLDYTRRLVSKVQTNPKKALPALATFIGVNYALIHESRKHMGVDTSRWFMFSPAGYAGSPHMEFVLDSFKAMKEDQEGRAARKRVLEYPLNFVPTFNEMRAVEETWDKPWLDENGHVTRDGYKVMGFRMQKAGEPNFDQVLSGDLSPEKFAEFESGGKSEYSRMADSAKKAYEKVTK